MRTLNLHLLAILLLLFTASMSMAKDFIIISIKQDFPMINGQTDLKKNFYLNVGNKHGIVEGTKLNVFRKRLLRNPYETKKNYNYKIKVGQLEVIHSEGNSAIAKMLNTSQKLESMQLNVENFMIGDKVEINLKE